MLRITTQQDETQGRYALRHRLKLFCDAADAGSVLATGSARSALSTPISASDVSVSDTSSVFHYNEPGNVFWIRRSASSVASARKTSPTGFVLAGKPSLFVGLLVLLLALPASASIISFSDDTFTPSNWSLTTQTKGPGGDASAVQKSSGGNPGAYRQVTVDVIGGSDSEVFAFNLKDGATVTPSSSGAIISLTYTEARDTTGQEFGPAIQQGSNLYYAYAGSGGTSGWKSTSMTFTPGAATNDLLTSFHTDINSNAHPDFSVTGAPMTFGFAAIDNSTASSFTAVSGYDNWSISVTTNDSVPEPRNIAVLALTGWALLRRPRRVA